MKRTFWVLPLALAAIAALLLITIAPAAAVGPEPGTVVGIRSITLYPATAITGSTTAYTASPRMLAGEDLSRTRFYHSADVFVSATFATTGTLTITPQASPDGALWASLADLGQKSDGTFVANAYALTLSGAGVGGTATGVLRIPLTGEYTRFMLAHTVGVTPTLQLTLRNDGSGATR